MLNRHHQAHREIAEPGCPPSMSGCENQNNNATASLRRSVAVGRKLHRTVHGSTVAAALSLSFDRSASLNELAWYRTYERRKKLAEDWLLLASVGHSNGRLRVRQPCCRPEFGEQSSFDMPRRAGPVESQAPVLRRSRQERSVRLIRARGYSAQPIRAPRPKTRVDGRRGRRDRDTR
jgi:hypothetical protein